MNENVHILVVDDEADIREIVRILLENKGYDPLAYRFFCLQSHYRKGLLFSWENLDNAAAAYSSCRDGGRRSGCRPLCRGVRSIRAAPA